VDFVDTAKVNKVFQKDKYILHFVCCYVQKNSGRYRSGRSWSMKIAVFI